MEMAVQSTKAVISGVQTKLPHDYTPSTT